MRRIRCVSLLIVPVLLAGCSSGLATPGGSATPTGGGGGGGGGDNSASVQESVPYGIYVGGIYTGAPCGPTTNSGYFTTLDFDSVFHNVVFARPSNAGLPGPLGGLWKAGSDFQAGMAYVPVEGEGKVSSFSLCPMYETETDSYPCKVTEGPNDVPVSLSIVAPQGASGSATLKFSTGSPEVGRPILRWDGKIGTGEWGGIGGSETAFFNTTWAELLFGEEFDFEHAVAGDDGESWHYSIRFIPETS